MCEPQYTALHFFLNKFLRTTFWYDLSCVCSFCCMLFTLVWKDCYVCEHTPKWIVETAKVWAMIDVIRMKEEWLYATCPFSSLVMERISFSSFLLHTTICCVQRAAKVQFYYMYMYMYVHIMLYRCTHMEVCSTCFVECRQNPFSESHRLKGQTLFGHNLKGQTVFGHNLKGQTISRHNLKGWSQFHW